MPYKHWEKETETIKTQQQQIDSLETANNSLQQQLTDVKNEINKIETAMSQCCNSFSSNMQSVNINQSKQNIDAASLEQNVPNPYNGSTTIHYSLPHKFSSAQIIITDNAGKTLKQINLSSSGEGSVNINASSLSSGTYNYSLIVDGKLIDTKKMILSK